MITIDVNTSTSYQVLVGNNLLQNAGKYIHEIAPSCKIAIISDSTVFPLYGNILQNSLQFFGYEFCHFIFQAGEAQKNADTYFHILNFLADNQITRSDLVIALGGGVVGDITGFAAATYLRGIRYMQIPTTLLAMVDSSIGGKTAIDLPAGKNLAGAFHQPKLVICDTDTLQSLPSKTFSDGAAEVIKYGVLYDEKLFDHLTENGFDFKKDYVISRCIELKRNVVAEDEFDQGLRQKLNLGHTIGHAIEAQSNFTISHGQAVAIGMAMIAKAAIAYGICKEDVYSKICFVLDQFKLPKKTDYTADSLYHGTLSDKKRFGGTVNFILPRNIGDCIIHPVPTDSIKSLIEAGL